MRYPAQYVIIFYSTLSSLRYSNFQYLTSDSTVTGIQITALIADLFERDVSNRLLIITFQGFCDLTDLPISLIADLFERDVSNRLLIITFQGFCDLTDLPIENLCQICAQLTNRYFYLTLNDSNYFGYLKIRTVT